MPPTHRQSGWMVLGLEFEGSKLQCRPHEGRLRTVTTPRMLTSVKCHEETFATAISRAACSASGAFLLGACRELNKRVRAALRGINSVSATLGQ